MATAPAHRCLPRSPSPSSSGTPTAPPTSATSPTSSSTRVPPSTSRSPPSMPMSTPCNSPCPACRASPSTDAVGSDREGPTTKPDQGNGDQWLSYDNFEPLAHGQHRLIQHINLGYMPKVNHFIHVLGCGVQAPRQFTWRYVLCKHFIEQ